jgi:hypothetical protein
MRMNLEEIHKKAEQERQLQARKNARTKKPNRSRAFQPQPAESWKVFRKIYPHKPNVLWWMVLPLTIATIGFVLFYIEKKRFNWMLPYTVALASIPVAAWLFTLVRELMEYPAYKNWQKTLGFPVNGWEKLGSSKQFPHPTHWVESLSVEVKLKGIANTQTAKLMEDVLYLFSIAANKAFYTADDIQAGRAGDGRYQWVRTDFLTVSGSANSSVMGELYRCIHKTLRKIHEQTNAIEAVTLKYSDGFMEVTPVQVSD